MFSLMRICVNPSIARENLYMVLQAGYTSLLVADSVIYRPFVLAKAHSVADHVYWRPPEEKEDSRWAQSSSYLTYQPD